MTKSDYFYSYNQEIIQENEPQMFTQLSIKGQRNLPEREGGHGKVGSRNKKTVNPRSQFAWQRSQISNLGYAAQQIYSKMKGEFILGNCWENLKIRLNSFNVPIPHGFPLCIDIGSLCHSLKGM